MGPGHAVWALQAVWIWLPGWSLQVCLGWAGSVQAKWCEALSCILRSGGPKTTFWAILRNLYFSTRKFSKANNCTSDGGKAEKWNVFFDMKDKI